MTFKFLCFHFPRNTDLLESRNLDRKETQKALVIAVQVVLNHFCPHCSHIAKEEAAMLSTVWFPHSLFSGGICANTKVKDQCSQLLVMLQNAGQIHTLKFK